MAVRGNGNTWRGAVVLCPINSDPQPPPRPLQLAHSAFGIIRRGRRRTRRADSGQRTGVARGVGTWQLAVLVGARRTRRRGVRRTAYCALALGVAGWWVRVPVPGAARARAAAAAEGISGAGAAHCALRYCVLRLSVVHGQWPGLRSLSLRVTSASAPILPT
jgi:hypothetical protein